jgi:hypothetical protein
LLHKQNGEILLLETFDCGTQIPNQQGARPSATAEHDHGGSGSCNGPDSQRPELSSLDMRQRRHERESCELGMSPQQIYRCWTAAFEVNNLKIDVRHDFEEFNPEMHKELGSL